MQGGAPQRLTCSFMYHETCPHGEPCLRSVRWEHFGTSLRQHARIGFIAVLYAHTTVALHPLHPTTCSTLLNLTKFFGSLGFSEIPTTTIPFLKISLGPTFSVPSNPQSPTLLGSNFGTKSYVLLPLRNLLLSNSCLFSPGYTLSPRFLSLGNTRRVPVTRPSVTTSRSNSPGYPQRGALPHAGDYSTLTVRYLHDIQTGEITADQESYIDTLLEQYNMTN